MNAPEVRPKFRIDPRYGPLSVMTLGTFMSILDTNIVNVALPKILQDFNTSLSKGQLVITSYILALAIVIPLSGFLGERIGMKRLYIITLVFFTVGSALCGLAWNVESLIFFRVMQGLGGGMLQPVGMALVFTIITPLERPKFISLLGMPALLAPLVGPTLGGYIVEYSNWRMVFLINVPVGMITILLAFRLLKESPIVTNTRLDRTGFAFATVSFPSLLFGLSSGVDSGWLQPTTLILLITGVTCFAAFVRTELRSDDPMLRLDMFANTMFRRSIYVQSISFFSLFGLNVLIPLFLQRVQGLDAATTGRVLLPTGIVAFIMLNISGHYYDRVGPRPIVMTGMTILALTTFFWSRIEPGTSIWIMVTLVAMRGLGVGLVNQIVQVVAYNTVPQGQLPRATALVNVSQRLVTAFSTAFLMSSLIIGLRVTGAPKDASIASGNAPIGDMTTAFHYTFILMTALCVLGIYLASQLRDHLLEEHQAARRAEAVEA